MVAEGQADVAAIDCVSFAHFARLDAAARALRVLHGPTAVRAYPTSRRAPPIRSRSRRCVQAWRTSPPIRLRPLRARLLLEGFDLSPAGDYAEVLTLERRAGEQGYAVLA